jgi:SAM-dependent methyltransferase
VVCSFALGHFPYPEISVTECIRTLRPGGRIGFAWWDHPTRQRIQGIFRETIAEIGVAPPPDLPGAHDMFRFSETPQFLQLLRGVGCDRGTRDHVSLPGHRNAVAGRSRKLCLEQRRDQEEEKRQLRAILLKSCLPSEDGFLCMLPMRPR